VRSRKLAFQGIIRRALAQRPFFGSIFWMRPRGKLNQVLAVEGRSCIRGDIDRAQRFPGRRIEGVQPVSRSEPDVPAVVRDAVHVVDTRKGSILTNDFDR
jgi:hypothetical protein